MTARQRTPYDAPGTWHYVTVYYCLIYYYNILIEHVAFCSSDYGTIVALKKCLWSFIKALSNCTPTGTKKGSQLKFIEL